MRLVVWVCATVALTAAFGVLAAYNLGNYRPITNDEVELIAVGYKLAQQGVPGSDLYAGFFGADQHFFITLPLQHVLEAAAFRAFGPGVLQARAVSVVAAIVTVWFVGWLAFRWYGLVAGLMCELLVVAWPSNVTAASNGLPLFGVGRIARYDVLAVACTWLAILLLDLVLRRPRVLFAFALGLACGLAALSQFMGVFVLPLVALNWWLARARWTLLLWVLLAVAIVVVPWLAFGALYWSDVVGQLTVYAGRGDFLRPAFYVENITTELGRYEHLIGDRSLRTLVLTVGVWPALAYVAWRSRCAGAIGDRIVASSLIVFAGLLLLLDHSKSSVYAIALVPSLCLVISRLCSGSIGSVWLTNPRLSMRLLATSLGALLLLRVCLDGVSAYQITLAEADQVSPYSAVGQQLERAIAPDARVFGPERWWWALHTRPYLSLRSVWWQWSNGMDPPFEADTIIVNDNVRADILLFPEPIQQRFVTFLRDCTTHVTTIDDPNYFGIDVYRVAVCAPCVRRLRGKLGCEAL